MPQKDDAELKKVTQMVKEKNYNHRELGILKHEDIARMKVHRSSLRRPSANPPKKRKHSKSDWPRKRRSRSWRRLRPRRNTC